MASNQFKLPELSQIIQNYKIKQFQEWLDNLTEIIGGFSEKVKVRIGGKTEMWEFKSEWGAYTSIKTPDNKNYYLGKSTTLGLCYWYEPAEKGKSVERILLKPVINAFSMGDNPGYTCVMGQMGVCDDGEEVSIVAYFHINLQ